MPYEDISDYLSTSFDILKPASSQDAGSFLSDVAFALNVKEAELARHMGVSRATLSGWRARGSVPAPHLEWIAANFVELVVLGRGHGVDGGFRHAGIEYALDLIRRTNFDPFGAGAVGFDQTRLCATYFEGLAQLSLFVAHRLGSFPSVRWSEHSGLSELVCATVQNLLASNAAIRQTITVSQSK